MTKRAPKLVVIADPNGAGESTAAPYLLRDELRVPHFVNADTIAQGLSGFAPEAHAFAAGRLMLQRLHALAQERSDFAFETTLASRMFCPWIKTLKRGGYSFRLVFLWLPTAEMSIARVRRRVGAGGHSVPDDVVRRRYERGLVNLFSLYLPLADRWDVIDNSSAVASRRVASGNETQTNVEDPETWSRIQTSAEAERPRTDGDEP